MARAGAAEQRLAGEEVDTHDEAVAVGGGGRQRHRHAGSGAARALSDTVGGIGKAVPMSVKFAV
ncbi:MAG: hypothetical protein U1F25_06815 [Rubrivivax sp.]